MNLHEPNVLKTRVCQVKIERDLPQVKVAVTGDFHISPIVSEKQINFLRTSFETTKPDVIILQGDIIDSPVELKKAESVKKVIQTFSLCTSYAPTALVLGSHDFITPTNPAKSMSQFALPKWKELCEKTGVKILFDEWLELPNIRIFGAFQDEKCILKNNFFKENKKDFAEKTSKYEFPPFSGKKINWFATHAPYIKNQEIEKYLGGFDVVSFGHTHGGIVPLGVDEIYEKFHFNSGLIAPNKTPLPRRVRGSFKVGKTTVIMNSGMVGAQYCAPKIFQQMNFLKAAEITLVKISGNH